MSQEYAKLQQIAAEWLVQLNADEAHVRHTAEVEFAAWRSEHPEHERAAHTLQTTLGRLQALRETPVAAALSRSALEAGQRKRLARRRATVRAASMLLLLSGVSWGVLSLYPPSHLLADVSTGTGQWRTVQLTDGSSITLDSNSDVNIHFDAKQRVLELTQGDLLVQVAHDRERPFIVKTAQGSMRALGTRFVVQSEESSTVLSVLQSQVMVSTQRQLADAATGQQRIIGAGERLRFSADTMEVPQAINPDSLDTAWANHTLVVKATPLDAVLRQLGRHHRGIIHFNAPQLQDISVSAVLPLDDTRRSLQLLQNSLPQLRIRTFTPYLVWVDLAPS